MYLPWNFHPLHLPCRELSFLNALQTAIKKLDLLKSIEYIIGVVCFPLIMKNYFLIITVKSVAEHLGQ